MSQRERFSQADILDKYSLLALPERQVKRLTGHRSAPGASDEPSDNDARQRQTVRDVPRHRYRYGLR
jgi:hypothetical protein